MKVGSLHVVVCLFLLVVHRHYTVVLTRKSEHTMIDSMHKPRYTISLKICGVVGV
jgi:hypothetical protein